MSSYTFRLDQFHITNTRARHNDTDVLALCFKVGEREFTYTKQLGDVNNGNHDVGFELPGLLIDDSRTPISLKYSLVNSGHDKAGVEAALKAIDNIGMAVGSALGLPQEASKAVRNSNLQYRPKTFHQTCRARSSAPMVRAGSSGPTSVPVAQFLHLSGPQREHAHGLAVPVLTVFTWFELHRTCEFADSSRRTSVPVVEVCGRPQPS